MPSPFNRQPLVPAYGNLHLDYQPHIQISNKITTGVEALCRWTGPVTTEALISHSEQSRESEHLGRQALALIKNDFSALLAKYPSTSASAAMNTSGFHLHVLSGGGASVLGPDPLGPIGGDVYNWVLISPCSPPMNLCTLNSTPRFKS